MPPLTELLSYPSQLDLMRLIDGTQIYTLDDWKTMRRPELRMALQHYIYGYIPYSYPIDATLLVSKNDAFDGLASYREVKIDIPLPTGNTATIYLALFLPNNGQAKKPVIVNINGQANHMSTTYDQVTIRTYGGKFPSARGTWQANYVANIEYPLTRGYALALFCTEDLDPDVDNDTGDGLYSLLNGNPNFIPGDYDNQMRNKMAWVWGSHRVIDYLVTRNDIDQDRIAINGFSRRGDAALVASALDDRIDLCWSHSDGGENQREQGISFSEDSYWFNEYYLNFIDNEDRLPFDGNAMYAMQAPRPVLDSGGHHIDGASYAIYDSHDTQSSYGEMVSASAVYQLYGVNGIAGTATGSSVPDTYNGKLYQIVDNKKGHYQDIEFWKHSIDYMDLQFFGHYTDPYTTYIYEAESYTSKSGCLESTAKLHYYGSGYIAGFDAPGDFLEWNNISPGEGTHYIAIRCSTAPLTDPKSIKIILNGQTIKDNHDIACWTDLLWAMDYRVKGIFVSGKNTLRIEKKDSGALNIDRVVIYKRNPY